MNEFKDWAAREKRLAENTLDGSRMDSWLELRMMSEFERREVRANRRQLRERVRDLEGTLRAVEEFDAWDAKVA